MSTITTIQAADQITDSRAVINTNFSNLNTDKAELVSPVFTTPNIGAATATTVNDLTLSSATVGFTIAGGTTSKTLTVPLDASVSGTNTGDQDLSTLVPKSLYDAHTVLAATTDNTPVAITLSEQTLLGRVQGGNITQISIDSALSTTSANHDTVPSAKATKEYADTKSPIDSPTFTGTVILPKTLEIQDTSADHQYVLAVNELTADRTVTLPLLTGNDEFTFNAHTQTLTNKRITRRVASTTSDTTAIIDCDTTDDYYLTAMAGATEISITGTPTSGQTIFIGLKDNGTTRALTWTGITALGVTLPTTTTVSKQHIIGIKYIASAWRAIAVSVAA